MKIGLGILITLVVLATLAMGGDRLAFDNPKVGNILGGLIGLIGGFVIFRRVGIKKGFWLCVLLALAGAGVLVLIGF